MKPLRLAFLVLSSLLMTAVSAADKPMAVWFYADWCMNCKMIAPKLAAVQPEFESRIDFIKLDVTNDERKVQTKQQAKTLRILPLYINNKATGWLALLDAQRKQVGELRHFMSEDEMRAALNALLAAPAAAASD